MSIISTLSTALKSGFLGIDTQSANIAKVTPHELMRPEGMRHYLMALPSQNVTEKRPLVVILHGGGASAKQVLGMAFPPSPLSVWLEIAEREQLVVVAPEGCKKGWNDSFADVANKPQTDDTGFIEAIIDLAIANHAVDPARVFVIGVSKGGTMAYRLASEIAPKLAGFAAVLATMPAKSVCPPTKTAISALIIANTKDPFIPFNGGKFFYTPLLSPMISAEETVAVWRNLAGLADTPTVTQIAHSNRHNPTSAKRYVWGTDPKKIQVSFVKVDRAGHTEPSQLKRYPWLLTRLIGAQNADIEVAEEAWAFFKDKRAGLLA
jgi:polyhydroxybutyrate depolymerase